MQKPLFHISISLLFLLLITGCYHDYSFEGGPVQELAPDKDSSITTTISFPVCQSCINVHTPLAATWNFKVGPTILCGKVENAIMNYERTAFTFFGPSACSADTGLIITAYFDPITFNKDQNNVTTEKAILQYYNNTTSKDILQSWPIEQFTLTIDHYSYATGIAKGSFKGLAITDKGDTTNITAGQFNVQMK